MPDLNPFDAPLLQVQNAIARLTARKDSISSELQWFDSTNETELIAKQEGCRKQAAILRDNHKNFQEKIAEGQCEYNNVSAGIRTMFNPKNWFAADQVQLRRKRDELTNTLQRLEVRKNNLTGQIKEADQAAKQAEAILDKYRLFDAETFRKERHTLQNQLSEELLKSKTITTRKDAVDQALKPVVEQMQEYERRKHEWNQKRTKAEYLARKLSNADNSYERAMAHKECEEEFNVGSPTKVIAQCEREIHSIERNYDKAYKRALEIGQKSARRIDKLVVDGNNLCYENRTFIGMAALDAIIPLLQSKYSVTIVFDAAIRRLLKADDKAISSRFEDKVFVHIVATGRKADETILDLAGNDKYTYVLSNDRFGEFNDKSAIQDGRVVRHEIVNNRIFIHDLGIETDYAVA